ncbi:MAG: hypothetical protein IJX17_01760 [Clostridia bacterium]|nr:hypothetical protein [Clostridia bacterium]
MDISQLIGLADVKEQQAFAFTSIYNGKVPVDELQKGIDDYCNEMAKSFITQHKTNLLDEDLRKRLRKHILNIGADKKHSGHRFYEALYSHLNSLENELSKNQGERTL